jgi:hypothetical protein
MNLMTLIRLAAQLAEHGAARFWRLVSPAAATTHSKSTTTRTQGGIEYCHPSGCSRRIASRNLSHAGAPSFRESQRTERQWERSLGWHWQSKQVFLLSNLPSFRFLRAPLRAQGERLQAHHVFAGANRCVLTE